jgi:hypothetical protein
MILYIDIAVTYMVINDISDYYIGEYYSYYCYRFLIYVHQIY